jgi:hypothetical protein
MAIRIVPGITGSGAAPLIVSIEAWSRMGNPEDLTTTTSLTLPSLAT